VLEIGFAVARQTLTQETPSRGADVLLACLMALDPVNLASLIIMHLIYTYLTRITFKPFSHGPDIDQDVIRIHTDADTLIHP